MEFVGRYELWTDCEPYNPEDKPLLTQPTRMQAGQSPARFEGGLGNLQA